MKFESLTDAETAYNELAANVETMLGIQAGITNILTALIAKHPDYEQLQLMVTTAVEVADASKSNPLSPKQREVARAYVEALQQIQEAIGQIRPLG